MRPILLLALLLLPAPFCTAQILIEPNPHAVSYLIFAGQPPRAVLSPLTAAENAKFQQVYDAVLHGDAALDAEGDAISAQTTAYRSKLSAAMTKIDPPVGPLIASQSPINQTQRDEILQDQTQAMQSDPTLQTQWDDLTKRMIAHQQKVDAAMLKLDPTLDSTFSKLSP